MPDNALWHYEYNLTDHLGNVRAVFAVNQQGTAEPRQKTDYYPFGMVMNQTNTGTGPENKFLYNGKELQDDVIAGTKLDWYDYGARMYDAAVGRFHTKDRFAEKYFAFSPYQYAGNNPIYYIEVNGDSLNVALIQRYDAANGTDYLQQIISDLSSQTGLTFIISTSGQLQYEVDQDGNPVIAKTTDSAGNVVEAGSSEARGIITDAISHLTTVVAQITTGRSNAPLGGSLIRLNPSQITDMMNGANNIDPKTLGFGMTFMHEILHTAVGGSLSDPTRSASWNEQIGDVVERMNIVRTQLNSQGANYGERRSYQGNTFGNGTYLPMCRGSAYNLAIGNTPPKWTKFIYIP